MLRLRWSLAITIAVALAAALTLGRATPTAQSGDARPLFRLTPDEVDARVLAIEDHLDYVPGEVLVKFKAGTTIAGQDRALRSLRSRPLSTDLVWNDAGVARLRVADQPNAHILAEQLSEQPEVEYAEPNYLRHRPAMRSNRLVAPALSARPTGTPSDTDYGLLQWNFDELGFPKAWGINAGASTSIIVANIDTGVTMARQTMTFPLFTGAAIQNVNLAFDKSPDLTASRFVSPFDFAFFSSGGPVLDFDGHGTHTMSTMAEDTNNAFALAGIAYNVRMMPVKVCLGYWELMILRAQSGRTGFLPPDAGSCDDNAIANGIRYAADHGAKIINISLGGGGQSQTIRDALIYAVQHGAFIAISMGNDGDSGNFTSYPAGDAATIDGAVSVAAVGRSLNHAYYSSSGPHCELAAPGGDNTDPGPSDFGFIWQVTLFFPDQDPGLAVPRFDRYAEIGYIGTSMAAPHVAGLAALIMSQSPGITPAAVEALIRRTALDKGTPGRDDFFGDGLIQPKRALFGFGIK